MCLSSRAPCLRAAQLTDPLVAAAGALPAWIAPLAAAAPPLLEARARRTYVAVASGGVSRAVARLQVRVCAVFLTPIPARGAERIQRAAGLKAV